MKHIFIVGSKGIPSQYGGFETFVEKLTENKKAKDIKYHVACLSDKDNNEFEYNGARCFNVKIPNVGAAKAVLYDLKALEAVYVYIKHQEIRGACVYILACRIGPFMSFFTKRFHRLGVSVFVNPDGHEWKRAKWNWAIRQYWKFSERLMIKHADLVICDSKAIQTYIEEDYRKYNPLTTFIAYGATVYESKAIDKEKYNNWLKQWEIEEDSYYLMVGRFVQENNFEFILSEFMKSSTRKSLIIVTNKEKNAFYEQLKQRTGFINDSRIKFVGTIYDQELLSDVRQGAFSYIHGHEVGGTNPSLLEALATTSLTMLLDVSFNREVALDAGLYFEKNKMSLATLLNEAEYLTREQRTIKGKQAKERISTYYTWSIIVKQYETLFLGGSKSNEYLTLQSGLTSHEKRWAN